jgi:hypothetical protein
LRLVGDQHFGGRRHFFAAAEAMRRILVNHTRDRSRLKRCGRRQRVDLDHLTGLAAASDDDLLGLDDALDRLAKDYPATAALMKLRFFAGITLGMRPRTSACPAERPNGTGVSPASPRWTADRRRRSSISAWPRRPKSG